MNGCYERKTFDQCTVGYPSSCVRNPLLDEDVIGTEVPLEHDGWKAANSKCGLTLYPVPLVPCGRYLVSIDLCVNSSCV